MATTGALTDYAENKVLDHILGTAAYTMPTVYLALLTGPATDAGVTTEITGAWYARKAATFEPAGTTVIGQAANNTIIDYGIVSGTASNIVAWALFDALIGGNPIIYGTFDNPQTASPGNHVVVPVGSVVINID